MMSKTVNKEKERKRSNIRNVIAIIVSILLIIFEVFFCIVFYWFFPWDVIYIPICLVLACICVLILVYCLIKQKGNKIFKIVVGVLLVISILIMLYYYRFSTKLESKLFIKNKYDIAMKDIKIEEAFDYSPPLVVLDGGPHDRWRSVILSANGKKYYLVYDNGWKEIDYDGDEFWNYADNYDE